MPAPAVAFAEFASCRNFANLLSRDSNRSNDRGFSSFLPTTYQNRQGRRKNNTKKLRPAVARIQDRKVTIYHLVFCCNLQPECVGPIVLEHFLCITPEVSCSFGQPRPITRHIHIEQPYYHAGGRWLGD